MLLVLTSASSLLILLRLLGLLSPSRYRTFKQRETRRSAAWPCWGCGLARARRCRASARSRHAAAAASTLLAGREHVRGRPFFHAHLEAAPLRSGEMRGHKSCGCAARCQRHPREPAGSVHVSRLRAVLVSGEFACGSLRFRVTKAHKIFKRLACMWLAALEPPRERCSC